MSIDVDYELLDKLVKECGTDGDKWVRGIKEHINGENMFFEGTFEKNGKEVYLKVYLDVIDVNVKITDLEE